MQTNVGRTRQTNDNRTDQQAARDLHPLVYGALLGFATWLILAVWGFDHKGDIDYLLVIVSGFLALFVAIPSALFVMVRSQRDPAGQRSSSTVAGTDADPRPGPLGDRCHGPSPCRGCCAYSSWM